MIFLLNSDSLLLDDRFSGLLLASHLVDFSCHLIKFLVKDINDLFSIMLCDEIKETFDDGITKLIGKFLDRIVNILSFEGFLELVKIALGSKDCLDFLGIFLWNLLSVLILLSLIDRVVGNAEVSQESVRRNDLLLLRISIGSATLFSGWLILVEFSDNVRKLVLDSLILLQSTSEGSTLGFKLPQVARQLLVG